jgi:phosphoribosylformylglycinamidine synthase
MQTKALVLSGYGINCEHETKFAIERAGGSARILHLNELIDDPKSLENYNFMVIPGGFSFGDDIGSGKVFANKMRYRLREPLEQFVKDGKLLMGICNGFQVIAKLGILPIPDFQQRITLTINDSGKFEDRWVRLRANPVSPCIFTKGIDVLYLPVRHGEGKVVANSENELKRITDGNLHALQYVNERGELAGYPYNPNGSVLNIAGICDSSGKIFGMMPHPEAFNHVTNHPLWPFGMIKEAAGLRIFRNATDYLAQH